MSVKDKVIFGLMVLLVAGGGYIQYSYTQIMDRMDVMEQKQLTHVDEVNKEFREDLRKLNLQFIGRGKHLHQAQLDIIANTDLIHAVTDSLASLIDDVQYELRELDRDVNRRFSSVEQNIRDLDESLEGDRRRYRRRFSDIEQNLDLLDIRLKEIENLSLIQKEKAKQKEKQ
jgi:uncharacterized membrane protein YccC